MSKLPAQKTLIVIAGPTAVGKTAMAIKVAQYFNTEIVSADSRQFYREITIGTAKPNSDELRQAKHHFINSHSVTDDFNVGDFEKQGLEVLAHIFAYNNVAVLAGGSGLFVKAICEGFDDLPNVDTEIRDNLNAALAEKGIIWLQQQLLAADPDYYKKVDINNPQRLIRALEVIEATGQKFSSFHTANKKQRSFNIIKIGLNLPREELYKRINLRVDLMMEQGLLDEVKGALPYRDYNALHTVGYTELFDYLDDKTTLEAAVALIKQNTRRFAKRQLTWFNKDKEFNWFRPDEVDGVINHIKELINL